MQDRTTLDPSISGDGRDRIDRRTREKVTDSGFGR